MQSTPLSMLIDTRLGGGLRDYVIKARERGADWRSIAAEISDLADRTVSHETLRSWFADEADLPIGRAS